MIISSHSSPESRRAAEIHPWDYLLISSHMPIRCSVWVFLFTPILRPNNLGLFSWIVLTNGPGALRLSSLCKSQGISNALALIETEAGRAESRTSGTDLRYSLKLASSDNNSSFTDKHRCSRTGAHAGLNLYLYLSRDLFHPMFVSSNHLCILYLFAIFCENICREIHKPP